MRKIKVLQADFITVVAAFLRIQGERKCLLESIPRDKSQGRYSIIAWDPVHELRYEDGCFAVDQERFPTQDPLKELEQRILTDEESETDLPFQGGALGYVGYDVIACYETLGQQPPAEFAIPDIHMYLFDSFLIFDHLQECIYLVEADTYSDRSEVELQAALDRHTAELLQPLAEEAAPITLTKLTYQSNFTKEQFEAVVRQAKEYIKAGDLFQVVPSQRLSADFPDEPFAYYRRLRVTNPSAYLYYLDFDETKVIGSSPESLVSVHGRKVTTNPIAGTRKRGATPEADQQLEQELLHDEKELAEHKMLIDLGRNDIGRVAEAGTVTVPLYMAVEKYRFVMHIVSVVEGRLKAGRTAMDALRATLPAGTVSGAPKIRAMERIYEFEPVKRGVYAGAVGYFSKDGQAEFAIAIRTMVLHQQKAYVQAGAGIVYDSDPAAEYVETLQKAKALLEVGQ